MTTAVSAALTARCQGFCELCTTGKPIAAYTVTPKESGVTANEVALCQTCLDELDNPGAAAHWQCLAGSIWNTEPAVQALSYRILHNNRQQDWAQDILSSVEPDESIVEWAVSSPQSAPVHLDSNGVALQQGDTVVLTQALNVKGTSFSAAKGTVVRKIRLVPDNAEQIEGKINDQMIVILTKFVRKSS